METRANYILIGAFALTGFVGILAFLLWFANIRLDRQFAYYDIDFPTVSGLGNASDVRFSGLPVGQVVDVGLSPLDDGTVRVRIEVDAGTPVRTDSVATIEAQGVTGVSYVGISAGSSDSPLLSEVASADVPMIAAGQSVLQSLSQDAPEILAETLEVVRELRQLIGGDNQARVQTILENVEEASASFALALEDFSAVSDTVSSFAQEIDRFNTTLDTLTGDASEVMSTAGEALGEVDALAADARQLIATGSGTLSRANTTIDAAGIYIIEDLGPATDDLRRSVTEIETSIAALGKQAGLLMDNYSETGDVAKARLNEAQETIAGANAVLARLDETLKSVDAAAQRLDDLMEGNAEPLIAELRVATAEATSVIRTIGKTAETDLAAIFSEIRTAAREASRVVETVGADLSSASARIDGLALSAGETLESARMTFSGANESLAAINRVLETGDRALVAAESAFAAADRVITEEAVTIAERLRTTLGELEIAVGAVAEEIPGVTEELRSASRSAEAAFAQIEGMVSVSTPAIRDFAATALPQYGRLAVETRALVDNLDTLIEQIRRDPSRFFLDPRTPEFRR